MLMIEFIDILARGGGGGSSGGGGAGGIIAIPLIIGSIIVTWLHRRKKIKAAKLAQQAALSKDQTWSTEEINARVTEVFYKFQSDWSTFNLESMKSYLTPSYYNHMELIIRALHQLGRSNVMDNVQLGSNLTILGIRDSDVDELDEFDVEVSATATDRIVSYDGAELFVDNKPFTELWHFERENGNWCLEGISQMSSKGLVSGYHDKTNTKYSSFSTKNDFYYNADFGWLLLPLHGALFGQAKFGTSDINHHIIGSYKDRVVQLFEYVPILPDKVTLISTIKKMFSRNRRIKVAVYTVGQITLPKNYGNIVVEQKDFWASIGLSYRPKGMQKMTFSPVSFNKKFNVFATDVEQVTSFELLHPVYLEKLLNLHFDVDIEVVGDNLYLYSADKQANFDEMLLLLQDAYDELER